jgi:hypothetical protein
MVGRQDVGGNRPERLIPHLRFGRKGAIFSNRSTAGGRCAATRHRPIIVDHQQRVVVRDFLHRLDGADGHQQGRTLGRKEDRGIGVATVIHEILEPRRTIIGSKKAIRSHLEKQIFFIGIREFRPRVDASSELEDDVAGPEMLP